MLVLFNALNIISGFSKCYQSVNGENYCFYTDGSALSWDEAREFCRSRNYTLPIIRDEHMDNVFQRFISDSNINNYVWIDAHANHVDRSDSWHWINGQTSG